MCCAAGRRYSVVGKREGQAALTISHATVDVSDAPVDLIVKLVAADDEST